MIVKVISIRYRFAMSHVSPSPDRIAELLVHVGRAARCEDKRSALTAAQWTCLRFFARANASSRTPSAFAAFQVTTRGTASQIIKSLERLGLVSRARSRRDRRSLCVDLTEPGRAMLVQDPLRDLIGVIDALAPGESQVVLDALSRLSTDLALRRAAPTFGTCGDCSHFGTAQDIAYCACMAAELDADDIAKLCASYAPACATEHQGARNGSA